MDSGRLFPCFLTDFSDARASWNVNPLLPVYLQLHNRLLHKIVRSKNDLKRKMAVLYECVWNCTVKMNEGEPDIELLQKS